MPRNTDQGGAGDIPWATTNLAPLSPRPAGQEVFLGLGKRPLPPARAPVALS